MIPKIIHYCWFGKNQKNIKILNYIKTWKEHNPDYVIMEWNENNFNINTACEYVKEAYMSKKWAFVSDYVRLYALKNYGGIYLDTDVEVLKSFNPLLDNKVFMCIESKCSICTAVIGAEKNSQFINMILNYYSTKNFILKDGTYDLTPNSQFIYNYLVLNLKYEYQKNKILKMDLITIFPSYYFSPINCYTLKENINDTTYCIHRYEGSWKNNKEKHKEKIFALVTQFIGEENRQRIKKILRGNNN